MQNRCFRHQDWVSHWGSMSCLEFRNPRMLLLKLTQETMAYPQSQLLRFLFQSFLLASVCYFQMQQTWKSSLLTHRASWLLHLAAQPGMEPRSPDFLSLFCPWQLPPSLVTRTLHHRVQTGLCHAYSFVFINSISLILLIFWRVGRKGSIILIVYLSEYAQRCRVFSPSKRRIVPRVLTLWVSI